MREGYNIPKHWKVDKLGKVLDIQGGSQPPKANFIYEPKKDYIQLLQIRDFGKKGVPTYVPKRLVTKFCEKEDILVARYGASLGKILTGHEGAYNVALAKVIDKKGVFEKRFIFYLLKTQIFQSPLMMLSRSAQNGFSKGEIAEIELPIPPLPEQQLIVSKIEELLSDLENGKQQLLLAQQQLKIYRQSLLKWAFEGKLTNKNVKERELPEGWKIVNIIDLAEKTKNALKAGPFGSSLKKEFYIADGYKIYGQEQVISDNAFIGDYYVSEEKYQELKSCKIKPFDVLISLVGTVGKVLILPQNCKPGIINPRLIKISLNTEIYLPKFFKYYFESSYVKSLYSSKAQGTTMDVLNLAIIKTIPFPCPRIAEQQLIVDELESKLAVCDKIEETISQSLLQAESLNQSILKKAFEGKLG